MRVELKYGDGQRGFDIPGKARVSMFPPASLAVLSSIGAAMNYALDNPLNCAPFETLVREAAPERVAIAVPDDTRAVPAKTLLHILLKRIYEALPELEPSAVTIIIGGGLHSPLDDEGQRRIIPPEVAPGCRVVAHDPKRSRMVDVGVTSRGTLVRVNAEFVEANLKIVIGQIDPHQFVGFTGGAKGAVIGCGSALSIEQNHSLMHHKNATVGRIDGNPAREDINEAGKILGIDLAVNVVLDPDNDVVKLFAGEPVAVLEKGAETCAALCGVPIGEQFDIVIASCGGYPKDICLYQAQKGLNLASRAAKHGGKILLLAACPQGVGDDTYFDYVSQFSTPEAVLGNFEKLGFKMGAHKAYLFAKTLTNYEVAVHSDLDRDMLNTCHLRAADPEQVMREWVEGFEGQPRVALVPNANTTYFNLR